MFCTIVSTRVIRYEKQIYLNLWEKVSEHNPAFFKVQKNGFKKGFKNPTSYVLYEQVNDDIYRKDNPTNWKSPDLKESRLFLL